MNRTRSRVLVTIDCAQADHAGQAVIIAYAVSGLFAFSAGSCVGRLEAHSAWFWQSLGRASGSVFRTSAISISGKFAGSRSAQWSNGRSS